MPKVNLTDRFCATVTARSITDFFDIKTKGLEPSRRPIGLEIVGRDVHLA